jgi:DNA-binding transcriptional regulator YhcF (GntR family)
VSNHQARGSKHENSKLTGAIVKKLRNEKRFLGCINKWASQYKVSPTTISRALSKKSWTHI